ncbi:hypothetical protein, partial [Kitasatospora sp. HPMI-4]|uniref:hypothetical protein n=1 Tax=Kitasatospora sp. HPMI-4 TaxID=3448443 RepID=UPI003F1C737E
MSKPFGDKGGAAGQAGGSDILGRLIGDRPMSGKKEKVPAYLPVELLDRLRNTVVGLQRDPNVEDPPVSLSAFVEEAVEAAIAAAEYEHNGNRPYPPRPHA